MLDTREARGIARYRELFAHQHAAALLAWSIVARLPMGALSAVGVRTLALLSLWLGLGFGAAEIAVPAFAESEGNLALAGVALAGFSAGSLVGGLVAGLRPSRDERRRIIVGTFALTGLMTLPLAASSIGSLALLLFVAGLPIAPVVAAVYGQIGRVAAAGSVAGPC